MNACQPLREKETEREREGRRKRERERGGVGGERGVLTDRDIERKRDWRKGII
jgi:hypothetical protein